MAPGKKGLSLEDKRKRMMEIFYESKDVFLLKDIEKVAPKSKGITSMSVKDVLTSLVDDGLVDTDKIGTSVYFWAFPSKASQARKRKLENSEQKLVELKEKHANLESEAAAAEKGRESSDDRLLLLSKLEEEKKAEKQLLSRLQEFSENDPAVLEEMAKEASVALDAANRWTDNIFSIQSWIKKKFPSIEQSKMCSQFGIPDDLDYIE